MQSVWYELKPAAIHLRKRGRSLRFIESTLGISRSTLSGWLKDVELTESQKSDLLASKQSSLVKAREIAQEKHLQKESAMSKIAESYACDAIKEIPASRS